MYDSTLIDRQVKRSDIRIIALPATKMAQDLGSIQVANLILLGNYLAVSKVLPMDVVKSTLRETLKEGNKEKLIPLNEKALKIGYAGKV